MKRGDLYYVNPPGFLGKVRPAVIVQANVFNHNPPSVTLCLLTSTLVDSRLRVVLQPSKANGLEKPSQVMIDKVMTLPLDRLSNRIGAVNAGDLDQISASLRAGWTCSGASEALRPLQHTQVLSRSALQHLPR